MRWRKEVRETLISIALAVASFICITDCMAEVKKGLLVYDSNYGSTAEVAYWIKAIVGNQQPCFIQVV